MEVIMVVSLLLGAAFGIVVLDEKRCKFEMDETEQ
jgi:hypothetical protein